MATTTAPGNKTGISVYPLHILGSLCADLAGGPEKGTGATIHHDKIEASGEIRDQLTVSIKCMTKLVAGGVIDLQVSGKAATGFESERSAVRAVIDTLRTQYGVFPADFSYAFIAEKRTMYNAMQTKLHEIEHAYFCLDTPVAGYSHAMKNFISTLTAWLDSNHQTAHPKTVATIRKMIDWGTASTAYIDRAKTETAKCLPSKCETTAPCLLELDKTAAMPMKLTWEASYEILRLQFETAVGKLKIQAPEIQLFQVGPQKYRATFKLPSTPYQFSAESDDSPQAAKAKLMYAALTYIHSDRGYGFIDIYHEERLIIENQINKFDECMGKIWHCGSRLFELSTSFIRHFTNMLKDTQSIISADQSSKELLDPLASTGMKMVEFRDQFDIAFRLFKTNKVDVASIERQQTVA